jgi:hypothetical protein
VPQIGKTARRQKILVEKKKIYITALRIEERGLDACVSFRHLVYATDKSVFGASASDVVNIDHG